MANKLNTACININKVQRIYLQVNSGNDANKYGFNIDEIIPMAKTISSLSNIHIEGIMMIPPFTDINNEYRNIFKITKKIQQSIFNSGITACINLSMGMSRDYELAIEEGATHIRIGTALFGNRD